MKFSNKLGLTFFLIGIFFMFPVIFLLGKQDKDIITSTHLERIQVIANEQAARINDLLVHESFVTKTLAHSLLIQKSIFSDNTLFEKIPNDKRAEKIKALNETWLSATDDDADFIRQYTENPIANILREHQERFPNVYGEIFITNKYGVLMASTGRLTTLAHAHKYWWIAAYNSGKSRVFIDDRGFDTSVDGYVIGFVVPIYYKGDFVGMIKTNVNLVSQLTTLIQEQENNYQNRMQLVRSGGRVILDNKNEPLSTSVDMSTASEFINKSGKTVLDTELLAYSTIKITKGDELYGFGGQFESIDQILGNVGESWIVTIIISKEKALVLFYRHIKNTLLIVLVFSLLMGITIFLLSRRLTNPITQLSKAMQRVRTGDLEFNVKVQSSDEIGLLTRSFNDTIDNLKHTTISRNKLAEEVERRKALESSLRKSEQQFHNLFNLSPLGITLSEYNGNLLEANYSFQNITGFTVDELKQQQFFTEFLSFNESKIEQQEKTEPYEINLKNKNGTSIPIAINQFLTPHKTANGLVWSIFEDITLRKNYENELRLNAKVFSNAMEGILITNSQGIIIDVNQAFCDITAYTKEDVLGKNPNILKSDKQAAEFYADMWQNLSENGYWRGEIWNKKKTGEEYAELLTISTITDDNEIVTNYLGLFSDITATKHQQANLEKIAHFDELTGLPNRTLLTDRMHQVLEHHKRTGKTLAVCFLDLDGFKPVNDTYGHQVGDLLLREVAARMIEAIRSEDTVARIGGDEFVLLLGYLSSVDEYDEILQRLINSIAEPYQIDKHSIEISASLGVTFYPGDNVDSELLLRHADQAMYIAKTSGKNKYHVFNPAVELRKKAKVHLIEEIKKAIDTGEIILFYQPQVDCKQGVVVGVEALVRWQHPLLGIRSPNEFLPIIEKEPLIIHLGEWLIETALSQLQQWAEQGIELTISVNIAAKHLLQEDFLSRLSTLLELYPSSIQSKLQIEITETVALGDNLSIGTLIKKCKKLNISFSLDDFGTGYSSLIHLKRLGTQEIKIDKSFVDDITHDVSDLVIVRGIISLADAFDQQVVAEGVETKEQLQLLQELGCHVIQGYYIAHPMPTKKMTEWLKAFQPDVYKSVK